MAQFGPGLPPSLPPLKPPLPPACIPGLTDEFRERPRRFSEGHRRMRDPGRKAGPPEGRCTADGGVGLPRQVPEPRETVGQRREGRPSWQPASHHTMRGASQRAVRLPKAASSDLAKAGCRDETPLPAGGTALALQPGGQPFFQRPGPLSSGPGLGCSQCKATAAPGSADGEHQLSARPESG